jgi:hypothetical protein
VNGRSALLVDTDFEPGDLKEIRLVLGPNSTVMTRDGQVYDLKTPSGQTSGVKLKLNNATLRERETFQLLLDFDVAKSIVQRGNWRPGNDKKRTFSAEAGHSRYCSGYCGRPARHRYSRSVSASDIGYPRFYHAGRYLQHLG